MGSNSSGSFLLVLTKCASIGGAGWHINCTQVPFSLASLSSGRSCLLGHEFIWNGLQQLRLFSVGPHKVCFYRWCRLAHQLYPGALLFGFSFFWSFSFTHFKKLFLLFESLMCSIRTLILLARILPLLTCLFTMMPTAHRVTM